MQDTNYSVGPKFFGTSTKSNPILIQSPGSTRATDVHQALELMIRSGWTKLPIPTGQSVRTQNAIPSLINSTDNTLHQIATRSLI